MVCVFLFNPLFVLRGHLVGWVVVAHVRVVWGSIAGVRRISIRRRGHHMPIATRPHHLWRIPHKWLLARLVGMTVRWYVASASLSMFSRPALLLTTLVDCEVFDSVVEIPAGSDRLLLKK